MNGKCKVCGEEKASLPRSGVCGYCRGEVVKVIKMMKGELDEITKSIEEDGE